MGVRASALSVAVCCGVIGAIFSVGSAQAADMPTKARAAVSAAPFSWAGFYMGVHAGGAWGAPNTGNTLDTLAVGGGGASEASAAQSASTKDNGLFGGFQLGYNVQSGSWVYGLETDLSASQLRASADPLRTFLNPPGVAFVNTATAGAASIDWFGTARGRLGFARDRALFYGTAGLAYGSVRAVNSAAFDGTLPEAGPNFLFSTSSFAESSRIKLGWAAGAGVDYAVTSNVILSLTYLHVDLGDIAATNTLNVASTSGATAQTTTVTQANLKFDTVRAGVSWKFSPI